MRRKTRKWRIQKDSQEQNPDANKYFICPNKIDWDSLKKLGITKEELEKSKALEPMQRGYKSPSTFPIETNFGSIGSAATATVLASVLPEDPVAGNGSM